MTYPSDKETFEKRGSDSTTIFGKDGKSLPFWSLEEYTKYPETYSLHVQEAYIMLRRVPEEKSVSSTASF